MSHSSFFIGCMQIQVLVLFHKLLHIHTSDSRWPLLYTVYVFDNMICFRPSSNNDASLLVKHPT